MHVALIVAALAVGADPAHMTWQVDGVAREALVYPPQKDSKAGAPVVFVFHGHGGNMRAIAGKFRMHELWPEAVVVYPQGLPASTPRDPEGKRPGWQHAAGDQEGRDLKFFDAMLADIKTKHRVDPARIYATGHSNGGAFTYLLWASRHDALAAVAPCAAGGHDIGSLEPLPAMHIAGQQDGIVPFTGQERTMVAARRINHCAEKGEPWADDCLLYPSEAGAPFVAFIHHGGHIVPDAAPALIVRFFREHAKAPATTASAAR